MRSGGTESEPVPDQGPAGEAPGVRASGPPPIPAFGMVRRGYKCHRVDHFLRTLHNRTPPVQPPSFDVARRGYDRDEVDAYIARLLAERGLG